MELDKSKWGPPKMLEHDLFNSTCTNYVNTIVFVP